MTITFITTLAVTSPAPDTFVVSSEDQNGTEFASKVFASQKEAVNAVAVISTMYPDIGVRCGKDFVTALRRAGLTVEPIGYNYYDVH